MFLLDTNVISELRKAGERALGRTQGLKRDAVLGPLVGDRIARGSGHRKIAQQRLAIQGPTVNKTLHRQTLPTRSAAVNQQRLRPQNAERVEIGDSAGGRNAPRNAAPRKHLRNRTGSRTKQFGLRARLGGMNADRMVFTRRIVCQRVKQIGAHGIGRVRRDTDFQQTPGALCL